jgi:putative transcriptional regulator
MPKYQPPTPEAIMRARRLAGHTQPEAARKVFVSHRTWQAWEAAVNGMPAGLFELYLIKTRGAK